MTIKRMGLVAACAACALLGAVMVSCGGERVAGAERDGPLRVVATIGMIADVARTLGGSGVEVEQLMGAGVDPHLYAPTRTDIQRLMEAELVVYNGLLLEGRMTDTLVRAAGSGRRVVAVTEGVAESELLMPEGQEGHPDPHVWMDVSLWSLAAERTAGAIAEARPGLKGDVDAALAAYRAELAELDVYAARVLGSIPEGQRVLVTAHDAFGYLGRRYGIEVVGIQGISTESEAGVRDIERLVELLVSRRVPAVFVESTVAERNVRALIEGAGAQGHEVRVGGTLFSDAMGPAGTYEGTYIGMIDHNVTTIARALGGEAPADGMTGKLGMGREGTE